MKKERNPRWHRGYRNVFCREYNHCLDHAISKSWNSFNCGRCELRFDRALEMERPFVFSQAVSNNEYSVLSINLDRELPDNEFDGEFDGEIDIATW